MDMIRQCRTCRGTFFCDADDDVDDCIVCYEQHLLSVQNSLAMQGDNDNDQSG